MTKGLYVLLKPKIPETVAKDLGIGRTLSLFHRLLHYLTDRVFTGMFKRSIKLVNLGAGKTSKVDISSFVLSKEQADFLYKEHREGDYHQGNVDYLASGEVKVLYVAQEEDQDLELDFILRRFTAVKKDIRSLEFFKEWGNLKRYNFVHVPDSVERATEDLKMLGLIN